MPVKGIEELRPALIAIGFLGMPAALFDFQLKWETFLAGFFAAFVVYLADHLLPAKDKVTWPLILLFSVAFGSFALRSGQFSLSGVLFYILLALFYVLPLLPGKKRLQDFPLPRVMAVVGAWAGLPLILKPFPIAIESGVYLAGMCATMLPAVLWSDKADAEDDQTAERHTWSTQINDRTRTYIIHLSLFIAIVCFSIPPLNLMLPVPLLYLLASPGLKRHPHHSDWFLLWPLIGCVT